MSRILKSVLSIVVVSVVLLYALGWIPVSGATALPDPKADEPLATAKGSETVVFAGGCFWGIQAVFEHVKGVTKATAGYSGGRVKNPSYEEVSSGTTGHAESVEVVYDPSKVTFGQLLKIFFSVAHNPTELNRQGPDVGTQYRSAIFYETPDQQRIAQSYVAQLTDVQVFSSPIVTQIVPFSAFYRAEDYHQDYALHNPDNPYIAINDLPKVANLKKDFPDMYVNYR
jgi:peptide-methionine (S)-S-oxide reductase